MQKKKGGRDSNAKFCRIGLIGHDVFLSGYKKKGYKCFLGIEKLCPLARFGPDSGRCTEKP